MKERIIRAIAGLFIIASLLLAVYVNINWLWFTAFVGINLLQSSITKWCLMEKILAFLGINWFFKKFFKLSTFFHWRVYATYCKYPSEWRKQLDDVWAWVIVSKPCLSYCRKLCTQFCQSQFKSCDNTSPNW